MLGPWLALREHRLTHGQQDQNYRQSATQNCSLHGSHFCVAGGGE